MFIHVKNDTEDYFQTQCDFCNQLHFFKSRNIGAVKSSTIQSGYLILNRDPDHRDAMQNELVVCPICYSKIFLNVFSGQYDNLTVKEFRLEIEKEES